MTSSAEVVHGSTSVSPKDRVRLLRWWWSQSMGMAGAVALLLAVSALVVVFWVQPWLETQRSQLLRRQIQQLQSLSKQQDPAQARTGDRDLRDIWRDGLPAIDQRGQSIKQLLTTAHQASMQLERVEYEEEPAQPGLIRVRIRMPVLGSYAQFRKLTADLLNAVPHAALDSIELEQGKTEIPGATLQGKLLLSLYFRKEAK
jgi:Tfp pilus assembly protein PilO